MLNEIKAYVESIFSKLKAEYEEIVHSHQTQLDTLKAKVDALESNGSAKIDTASPVVRTRTGTVTNPPKSVQE